MSSRKHFSASWAKGAVGRKGGKNHESCRGEHAGDPALSFALETGELVEQISLNLERPWRSEYDGTV